MRYESHKTNELAADDIAKWAALQAADPRLASPFLRPEFSQWLGDVRDDTRVVVLREGDVAVGFFPYGKSGAAVHPAGTPLSLCQAVVAESGCCWDGLELLRATGSHRLTFDQWIPDQEEATLFCGVDVHCPYVDLSQGFDAYLASKRAQGSDLFKDVGRKSRKLARTHGAVRCELIQDPQVIEQLIQWKSAQCERTQVADLFRFRWPTELIRASIMHATDACGGLMWGLYAGQQPIALTLVLRSYAYAHGWVMAFDEQYSQFSPGMILLHEVLQDLPTRGITRLDMGKGVYGYKRRIMSGTTSVREGIIDGRPLRRAAWTKWLQTRNWLRHSEYRPLAHRANRVISNIRWLWGSNY